MLAYLLSKANKAGLVAYVQGNAVAIELPITIHGHGTTTQVIHVSTIEQYNNLIGA